MSLTAKIIVIVIEVIIGAAATYLATRSTRQLITTQKYLQSVCTKKTTGKCKRFIKSKNKWQAVYQFNTKNGCGEYITAPKSNKEPKPKIGQKITLMINPKNPNEVYSDAEMIMQTDASWKKKNASGFIIAFYLLLIIIAAIILTR